MGLACGVRGGGNEVNGRLRSEYFSQALGAREENLRKSETRIGVKSAVVGHLTVIGPILRNKKI